MTGANWPSRFTTRTSSSVCTKWQSTIGKTRIHSTSPMKAFSPTSKTAPKAARKSSRSTSTRKRSSTTRRIATTSRIVEELVGVPRVLVPRKQNGKPRTRTITRTNTNGKLTVDRSYRLSKRLRLTRKPSLKSIEDAAFTLNLHDRCLLHRDLFCRPGRRLQGRRQL